MMRANHSAVSTNYEAVIASVEAETNHELQQEVNIQRTNRLPSPEAPPEHYGLQRSSRNRGRATSCDSLVNRKRYDVERPATLCTPGRAPKACDTSPAAAGAPQTYMTNTSGALHTGCLRSVNTLITDRRPRMSASIPTFPRSESCGEQSDFAKTAVTLSKYLRASTLRPQAPQLSSESSQRKSNLAGKVSSCADPLTTNSPVRKSSRSSLSQGLEISTQVHQSFSAVSNGRPVSHKVRTFVKGHSKSSSTTRTAAPKKRLEELLRLSSSCPAQSPSTKGAGILKARAKPDKDVHAAEGPWNIFEPRLQPLVAARHKLAPLTPSADRRETQVMTVLVSRHGSRSESSAVVPGTEATRLFSKPSMVFSPIGAGARTTAAGRPTTDFAKANVRAAGGAAPAGVTSRGPAVMSPAAVIRPTTDFGNVNVPATGGSAPAGRMPQRPAVMSPAAVVRPSADLAKVNVGAPTGAASAGAMSPAPAVTPKRLFALPPPVPAPQPAALPKIRSPTSPPQHSQAPGTAGAAAPGVGATTAAGPVASTAVPVGTGPASGAVAAASPASAAGVSIRSASVPTATAATGAAPTVGFNIASPFSPVLESELFADSQSEDEPEYELSDTTIMDVNPCLLLPLSGCNFLLIVASVIFFFGALYAYFDQESTPASTSTNTWLVYLFLHLETVFMVASLSVFLVASVGFLGALRENVMLLDLYVTIQGSFITVEVVFIFIVFFLPVIGREFVISHITTELIVHYRDNPDYQREIDYVQSSLRCCGMTENTYHDWNANEYFNCSPTNPSAERCSVPHSCCRQVEVPDSVDGIGAIEPRIAVTGTAEEDIQTKENVEGDVYVPTLCGRGVMNLKEKDAWKRIYTRGCGAAMFHYVESRIVDIVLYTLLVILAHLFLISLAANVRKEIVALGKVYDKYYKVVYRGQKSMKRMNIVDEEAALVRASPQGPPLVASKEARRQRHRRRYLDVRPAWKALPKQAAPAAAENNI